MDTGYIYSEDILPDFNPIFEVAGCFVEHNDKILLLMRQDHKPQPNVYGMPAGKLDEGESPISAMKREIEEETQISLTDEDLIFIRKIYVRYPDYDFVWYIFRSVLENEPEVSINDKEHKSHIWLSIDDALRVELVPGIDASIEYCYGNK